MMKLRAKLEKLGDIDGLTHEEKGTLISVFLVGDPCHAIAVLTDPEEFLNTLLQQVFKEEPYLVLRY